MYKTKEHTDKFLVKELITGNEKAFRKLFDLYRQEVYSYSKSLVKSSHTAEEIVQDVFLKVWLQRKNINPDLSFKSFIFTIARNLAFNFLKKAANNKKLIEEIFYRSQKFFNATEQHIQEVELEIIRQEALKLLPPKRKRIFQMSRDEGKSYQDISLELKISVSTVKNQMSKALETHRTFLQAHSDISFIIAIVLNSFFD